MLRVALDGQWVARIEHRSKGNAGDVTLSYEPEVDRDLTPALPVQAKPHRGVPVLAFLSGLLPDDATVRQNWARRLGVVDHPVDLLAHMGLECAGAVQFVSDGNEELLEAQCARHEPLTEAQIGRRLRDLRTGRESSWTVRDEHWSLGGAQAKFALARIGDQWCEATGAAATTHIFKPGILTMTHQAAVEFATMTASRMLGLPTAKVDIGLFDGEPTLMVERFDRRAHPGEVGSGDAIQRLHQVDLCQAAGVMPDAKYEAQSGLTARSLANLLRASSTGPEPDVHRFSDALIFNYLAECPDGHAKNHALLLTKKQIRLAPFYDLATGAPYDRAIAENSSAFAIGGVRRFGEAYPKHWAAHAKEFGLDPDERVGRVRELARVIPDAFRDAFHDPRIAEVEPDLGAWLWLRMSSGPGRIGERCAAVLERLERG